MCFGNLNEHRKYKIIVIPYEITLYYFYFRSAASNSIAPVRTLQTQNGIRLVPASQLRQVQVILCQINTIFRQLTQNMTTDCSVRAILFLYPCRNPLISLRHIYYFQKIIPSSPCF